MTTLGLRRWAWIHKWSSLVCTLFMLLLCVTGLPLIFHHEIGHLLGTEVEAPAMPSDTPMASMDDVLAAAHARHPDLMVRFVSRDADETGLWFVNLAEKADSEDSKAIAVDARTAEVLAEPKFDEGFMYVMFKLHVDLFAGLPGKLFLGLMGMLLVIAIVSGVVLYAPFMRKLDFGTVRRKRSNRLKWLDLHNLLGIVTLVWALAVGATGVINTWADLVIKYWQYDQMTQMIAPYKGMAPPEKFGSLETAVQAATKLEADMNLGFIAFPGSLFSSPHHYAIFMRGTEPLTVRLFKPVLVDAVTGEVSDSRDLPWYVTALLVSQPLHFGDYGGMPLQILWAVLDILTIVVLWSGLVLWWRRRKQDVVVTLQEAEPANDVIPAMAKEGA